MENTPFKQLLAGILDGKDIKQLVQPKVSQRVKKSKDNTQKGKKVS
jgi:hypothetical protein